MTSTCLKRTAIRFAALLTSFVIGITAYSVVPQPTVIDTDIPTAAAKRQDNLHRLYEAAWASGDDGLRSGIILRLSCVDPHDSLESRFVQVRPSLECEKAREDLESERFSLPQSHTLWTQHNMGFIREIDTPEKARAYVLAHLSDFDH